MALERKVKLCMTRPGVIRPPDFCLQEGCTGLATGVLLTPKFNDLANLGNLVHA